MNRVALYVRVSTEEQKKHGLSVDTQIDALTAYAKENGYIIENIYNDAGYSASKSYKTRPALNAMIEACQSKKVDLILFTKLDRFFRNVPDYYAVMEKIGAVPWSAIWEDYETQTSSGKFKVNIMLSVAQSEADRTSERIKNTFEYKKARGEVCSGGVATGYVIKDKRWYIDKEVEPAIRAFYATYKATLSKRAAVEAAKDKGLFIGRDIAIKLLYGPAYYGALPYVAEAYLTQEDHDFFMKTKPYRSKSQRKYSYMFSGLCKCGVCGAKMVGAHKVTKRKNGKEYIHTSYYCRRAAYRYEPCHASVTENTLEEYLLKTIAEELDAYNIAVISTPKDDNTKALANLKSRLQRIKDLYELGDLDFTEYKAKRTDILDQIDAIQKEPAQQVRQLPTNWLEVYRELDNQHKNAFWASLIDYIEVPEATAKAVKIVF